LTELLHKTEKAPEESGHSEDGDNIDSQPSDMPHLSVEMFKLSKY